MASPVSSTLPSRTATGMSLEDAVPNVDPTTTAGLLAERLQAWKHAVGYLEDYMSAVEKIHGRHAKEYEKVLKTVSSPLKEGHHFDQSLGGIAGFFENLRANTQAMINTNLETEKSIKGSVLPILERLHKEIKHKAKELDSGAYSGAKEVEKLRNTTQKHIELLGQQTAAFDSAGGKLAAGADDPYVVYRGVLHRLSNQVLAENNHTNDLISVQNNFAAFEAHIIEVLQEAVGALVQLSAGQADKIRALHADVLGTVQCVPKDFEWANFSVRCADRLADPADPARSVDAINFPNMAHAATRPLIEGSLERKSRNKLSFGYSTGYYVVTPSKFLHEFKDSDDARQDPKPELSIYLPDAVIGAPSGDKFNIKGRDKSKTFSSKLTGSSEFAFKAHTAADAQKWFNIVRGVCGATGPAEPNSPVSPSSPASVASPTVASPSSATNPKDDALALNAPSAVSHKDQESGVTRSVSGASANPVPAAATTAASDEKKKVAEPDFS
ncbi:PH domain protein [Cordyceps fumosorosea ARSEF 2679]|uniref:PH domain protein n=1 Tax=Cordyceps fumosorosea (strain ARSEF 2679) TaxID=1081104 RepID=A0A162LH25_CORFA|nr:PH domain protein [Cordyceps fumosorosea ARSEF 2679]OAA70494.1 PH domain protein [Cordyceps fumosorosea ARSEF 2679]